MYSRIIIEFVDDVIVGDEIGFDIVEYSSFGMPMNFPVVERVVSTRYDNYEMGVATPTGVAGEASAINYYNALAIDMGYIGTSISNYELTRDVNKVILKRIHNWVGYSEFYVPNPSPNYENSENVNFIVNNNVEGFELGQVEIINGNCANVTYNITAMDDDGTAIIAHITSPSYQVVNSYNAQITLERGTSTTLTIRSNDSQTASQLIITPPKLSISNFEFSLVENTLTISNNTPLLLIVEYSLDGGDTWSYDTTYTLEENEYSILIRDSYGCVISHSDSYILDESDAILARSPYYVSYRNTAPFDYAIVSIFCWTGENNVTPAEPFVKLRVAKVDSSDEMVWVNVSPYIEGKLNPILDESWYTQIGLTIDNDIITIDNNNLTIDNIFYNPLSYGNAYDESVWVQFVIRAYRIDGDTTTEVDEIQSPIRFATLGYGYHFEGNNPKPTSPILADESNRKVAYSAMSYKAEINPISTNTNNIIKRTLVNPVEIIPCSHNTQYYIIFLNKWGVWEQLACEFGSEKKTNIESENSRSLAKNPFNYNKYQPTTKVSNIKATCEYVVNTPILSNDDNGKIEEIFLADRWYLLDFTNQKMEAVILTDKTFNEKIYQNQGIIQWSLTFKGANEKINRIQ